MQTFLPYASFKKTAECLDYKRLGKQRVEAKQILECLLGLSNLRWKNHPAVKMWKGYEHALSIYGWYICLEWSKRGYKDTLAEYFIKYVDSLGDCTCVKSPGLIHNIKFQDSHRSNLLRKNKEQYSQFDWNVPDNLPYIWKLNSEGR